MNINDAGTVVSLARIKIRFKTKVRYSVRVGVKDRVRVEIILTVMEFSIY